VRAVLDTSMLIGAEHPGALERHGLKHIFTHRGLPWQVAGFER